jgi:hypothetical protein
VKWYFKGNTSNRMNGKLGASQLGSNLFSSNIENDILMFRFSIS